MNKQRLDNLLLWTVAAAVALLPLTLLDIYSMILSSGDEGVLLSGARRVLHGQVPFRDFFSFITPGVFYLLAALTKVFGETFFAARMLYWLTYVATLCLILLLCARLRVPLLWKFVALAATLAYGPPCWYILSHHWVANAFVLASALALLKSDENGKRVRLFWAGFLAGWAALVLQDEGAYWILGGGLALGFAWRAGRMRRLAAYGAGVLAGSGPMALYLIVTAGFGPLWDDLIVTPMTKYRGNVGNRVAFGEGALRGWGLLRDHFTGIEGSARWAFSFADLSSLLGSVLVVASFPLAAMLLTYGWWRWRREADDRRILAVLSALCVALFVTALHRPAMINLFWAFPGPLLVCLWWCGRMSVVWPGWRRVAVAALVAVPFVGQGLSFDLILPMYSDSKVYRFPAGRVRSAAPGHQESLALAQEFREKWLAPGETVFCYNYNPAFYYLLRLDNPTRYDIWNYTMFKEEHLQEIMASLKAHPPDWILWDRTAPGGEPVIAWIFENYSALGKSDSLYVLRRKTGLPWKMSEVESRK